YSEKARHGVVQCRDLIARWGYQRTPEDVRRARQRLLQHFGSQSLVFRSVDFFSISGCIDLLFHVQEHRTTLPQIKDILKELDLTFLGIAGEHHLISAFRRCYPDPHSLTNLDHWHRFELENPNAFVGMYQFWVQTRR